MAVLLKQKPSKVDNYMRLLKLLYIADKESYKDTGKPITGDKVVAMKRGPVLSSVYDLIKGSHFNCSEWEKFIQKEEYDIKLAADPGNDQLCKYEIEKLQEVWDRYRHLDELDLVNETHKFSEWIKNDPGDSSKIIPLRDILEAVGRQAEAEEIEAQARESAAFSAFFQGA